MEAFDGETLLSYVKEVDAELPDEGRRWQLIVVGGALLAWHGLRDATHDVDTVERIDEKLAAAVARVATRHDLAPRWINDSAASFLPRGFEPSRGDEIWSGRRLTVLGAPLDQVFLMKVYAGRAADSPDLRALWPATGFASPASAAAAFSDAYPLEDADPHLAEWIDEQVR